MNKRTHYPPEFKTKVVLEVLVEEQTVNQIAAKYSVSPVVCTAPQSQDKNLSDLSYALLSFFDSQAALQQLA